MAVGEANKTETVDEDKAALDKFSADNAPEKPETKPDISAEGDDKSATSDDTASDETVEGDEEDWTEVANMRELLDSLEISDDEAREFSGPEELERHVRLIDKRALKKGEKIEEQELALDAQDVVSKKLAAEERAAEREAERARDEDGKFASKDGKFTAKDSEGEEFDDNLVAEMNRLGAHHEKRAEQYEKRIAQLESGYRELEANHKQENDRQADTAFDTIVHSLDHDDLFGTPEKPNSKAIGRLRKAYNTLSAGMKAEGASADMTPTLVTRALGMEFADELTKQHRTAFNRKLQNQSKQRLGGGGQRTSVDDQKWSGDIMDDPVLKAAYDKFEKQSGG